MCFVLVLACLGSLVSLVVDFLCGFGEFGFGFFGFFGVGSPLEFCFFVFFGVVGFFGLGSPL